MLAHRLGRHALRCAPITRSVLQRRWISVSELQPSIGRAFNELQGSLSLIGQGNRIQNALEQISGLKGELNNENIWAESPSLAAQKQKQLSDLEETTETYQGFQNSIRDISELRVLADEAGDLDLMQDILKELEALSDRAETLVQSLLLSEPADSLSAFIEIKAGSGGTEACDWASMLSRMYTRWAQSKDYPVKVVDETLDDVAGIKSRILQISGPYVFGISQFESGVHRLVRISPFGASGQRHTSFASVQVSPAFEDTGGPANASLMEVNPADLRITTMRSSGAGGQHVNKTESAVRIVHFPSGIVVACQQERSQQRNRVTAIALLKAKLFDLERKQRAKAKASAYDTLPEISWGSQIRSYVLQPYQLIKDARTGYQMGSGGVQAVLDGDLDGFMNASLKHFRSPKKQ